MSFTLIQCAFSRIQIWAFPRLCRAHCQTAHRLRANRLFFCALLLLSFCLASVAPCLAAPDKLSAEKESTVEVTDDSGYKLALKAPAKRIIALYGAYNEILLALGCAESIVARTVADEHILANLPAIGTHMRPNAELVAMHKPDLVLQMSGRKEAQLQTEALRKLGIPVLSFEINSFAQLFRVLKILGVLTGREAEAAALAKNWQQRLAALRTRPESEKKARIFYEVRYPNLLSAGTGGIVNEIIAAAGGENVLTEAKKILRCNEETVYQLDPDVYIFQKGSMNPMPEPLEARAHFKDLRAVRLGNVLEVREDLFSRPGPGSIKAAEDLAAWLATRKASLAQHVRQPGGK